MTILFAGGEDHDFTLNGVVAGDTTGGTFNSRARCSVKVGATTVATDGAVAPFASASANFWAHGQFYISNATSADLFRFLRFRKTGTERLRLSGTGGNFELKLQKVNSAGTATLLATFTGVWSTATLMKMDVYVNYAVSGEFKLYVNDSLVGSYTGDLTTDSETSLDEVTFGKPSSNSTQVSYWSECIVSTTDTRSMTLHTLPPAANGNAFAWTGSYADVDEIIKNDADLCTSSAANDLMQTTVTSSSVDTAKGVVAVVVSARGMKGGSGPTQAQLNVRTGAADYFSASKALDTALGRVFNIWETNPGTAAAWAATDLTAAGFNIGIKSIA